MKNTKHTPGPWQISDRKNKDGSPLKLIERAIPPSGGGINSLIAVLPDRFPSPSQWGPNARLIAAAPELLEALEFALADIESGAPIRRLKIEAAIAKARGES